MLTKNIAYKRLYQKHETKKGEKEVIKLARIRERRIRGLGRIRCIMDENDKIFVEEAEIKKR